MRDHPYQHIDPLVLYQAAAADLDAFRDLSNTYLEIAPPMLDRLEQAALAGDCAAAAYESHSLKGTTSLVGATHLTDMLKEIEVLARRNEIGGVALYVPELKRLFSAVTLEVQESIAHFHGEA